MTIAISSHGTLIARAPSATPTTFSTIGELGDIQMPGLMRNEFDATPQNRDIDSYVTGVLRRQQTTFPIFYHKDNTTHLGLYDAIIDNSYDGYRFTSPDGQVLIMSGFVQSIVPAAPVDGLQVANVTLRFSGPFVFNGEVIGADVAS